MSNKRSGQVAPGRSGQVAQWPSGRVANQDNPKRGRNPGLVCAGSDIPLPCAQNQDVVARKLGLSANPTSQIRNSKSRRKLSPIDMVDHAQCTQVPSADRVQCGKCEKVFARGAVVLHVPLLKVSEAIARQFNPVLECYLYCDHCQHIMHWSELFKVSRDGEEYDFVPIGHVTHGPQYDARPDIVAKFLRKHPQAAGVLQK